MLTPLRNRIKARSCCVLDEPLVIRTGSLVHLFCSDHGRYIVTLCTQTIDQLMKRVQTSRHSRSKFAVDYICDDDFFADEVYANPTGE
jgi:hypothetical protein